MPLYRHEETLVGLKLQQKTGSPDVKLWWGIVASAFLLPLALPNEFNYYGNGILGMFCLVPYYLVMIYTPNYRWSLALGAAFGVISTLAAHYWLFFYQDFSLWTTTGVASVYLVAHGFLAMFYHGILKIKRSCRPLVFAAVWCVFEYFKSSGFIGFPWSLLPQTNAASLPLIQIVDITGIWGLSLLIALINALIAEIIMVTRRESLSLVPAMVTGYGIFTVLLLGVVLVYSGFALGHWNSMVGKNRHFRVLMVQQNDDPWAFGGGLRTLLTGLRLTDEGMAGEPVDLVVWSETSFPGHYQQFDVEQVMNNRVPLGKFIKTRQVPMLLGLIFMSDEVDNYQNASVLFSSQARYVDSYAKQHLVPLAEKIPFWNIGFIRDFFIRIGIPNDGWVAGLKPVVFKLNMEDKGMVNFSTPICFEDTFPYICRGFVLNGADVLINLSNVSWSRQKSAEIQMYAAAIFRAVENRRYLLRSTNGGVTAYINETGQCVKSIPLFEEGYLLADVPLYDDPEVFRKHTIYTRLGDYFPWVLYGFLLAFMVFQSGRRLFKKLLIQSKADT